MTARFYEGWAEDAMQPLNNVAAGNVVNADIVLVTSAYVPNFSTHVDRTDLTNIIDTGPNVAGRTVAAGLFSITSPYVIPTVASGSTIAAWVLVETGAGGRLIYFNNEDGGLPLATNDQNVNLLVPSGIFRFRGTV